MDSVNLLLVMMMLFHLGEAALKLGDGPPLACFHCTEKDNCNEKLGESKPCKSPYDRCATYYDSGTSVGVVARGCDRRILSGCYRTGVTTQACVCSYDHCNNFKIQDLNLAFTREEIAARAADIFKKSAAVSRDTSAQTGESNKDENKDVNDVPTPETVEDMLTQTREHAGKMLAKSFLRFQLSKNAPSSNDDDNASKEVAVRKNVVKNLVTNYLRRNPTHDVEVVAVDNDDIHLHFYETVTPKPTVINIPAVMREAQNIISNSAKSRTGMSTFSHISEEIKRSAVRNVAGLGTSGAREPEPSIKHFPAEWLHLSAICSRHCLCLDGGACKCDGSSWKRQTIDGSCSSLIPENYPLAT
ncbi:unnamed protein product [Notodromas monacha]|uniref:Uncharacterized protein n=1 Tax=Notodromas monacha TaxID=399045 RepID=A0A7R9C0V4_9CRUS|nr:unnamed protein product [Notodromas monacha]CAG0923947.1 unnamed protein product [Notodromas monacha]